MYEKQQMTCSESAFEEGAAALGEFEIIRRFFVPLSRSEPGALSLTDDAAVLSVAPEGSLVVSTDTIIAGRHFFPEEAAADIAAKGLAVAYSDIAAMGAAPFAYTLSLSLPLLWEGEQMISWLEAFCGELQVQQQAMGVGLAGGDTVGTSGPLSLTFTVLGVIDAARALRRSNAHPGDLVYVSGSIGDAAMGLSVLTGGLKELDEAQRDALVSRFRRPQPRLALGSRLAGVAHAAADISDGLAADLGHICDASGVRATIRADRIPLSLAARAALRANPARMAQILGGGDDYELVFAADPAAAEDIARIAIEVDLPLTPIGRIDERTAFHKQAVLVVDEEGRELEFAVGGYRHF
jgi:thiamine-monophosphate kinase